MSDTPRTDELELNFQRDNLDTHLKLVLALRFAEKLERENAALREALDTLTHVIGLTPIAGNKAALQEAFDMARAALRKEAQP